MEKKKKISFRVDWFDLFEVQETLKYKRVFSSTTIQKLQFFSAQSSLWSSSHISIWLSVEGLKKKQGFSKIKERLKTD